MTKYYDATKEHAPVEKTTVQDKDRKGRHPNKGVKGKNPFTGKTK